MPEINIAMSAYGDVCVIGSDQGIETWTLEECDPYARYWICKTEYGRKSLVLRFEQFPQYCGRMVEHCYAEDIDEFFLHYYGYESM